MRSAVTVALVVLVALVCASSAFEFKIPFLGRPNSVGSPPNDIWTNCGTASDHFQITNVKLSPDPPVRGQNFTVSASGTLDEQVTDGKAHLTVSYLGIKILDQTTPLCSLDPSEFQCPLQPGTYTHTQSILIPSVTPPGKYSGQVQVSDQNGQEIACVQFNFTM